MRTFAAVTLCLLLLRGLAWADEEPAGDHPPAAEPPNERLAPENPAEEMTEAAREEALERAEELSEDLVTLYRQGKPGKAIPAARKALALRERALGPDHLEVAVSLNNLATLLRVTAQYAQARPLFERAIEIRERALGSDHPAVARTLNDLGLLLHTQGSYQEARPLYERALGIREKALGPEHPHVAISLHNLAELLRRQGLYEEAKPLYERALEIKNKVYGSSHSSVATSQHGLAVLLHSMGMYERARVQFERALEIREKSLGLEHPHVAVSLCGLAGLLRELDQYEDSRRLYERALHIEKTVRGPRHPSVASILSSMAVLFADAGQYEQARSYNEQALSIREEVHGPDSPLVATTLNNLAQLLQVTGQFDTSRALFDRALAINEKALGPEHPSVAAILNNLGLLLRNRGRYEDARQLFERALRIHEQACGPEHSLVATSLNNLALLADAQGDYEDARPLYERALEIRRMAFGREHHLVASSLNNLAQLLQRQGARTEARPLYERALEIREQVLGPAHPQVAESLNNLAVLLKAEGLFELSRSLLERALSIYEKVLGPEHPSTATTLNNLALLLDAQGDLEAAKALHVRALELREKAFGRTHPRVAESLSNMAVLLHRQGGYADAKSFCERALEIRETVYGADHPSVAVSLDGLAVLLVAMGQDERARSLLARCLDIVEGRIRDHLSGLSVSQRRTLVGASRHYLENWLGLALRVRFSGYAEVLRFKGLVGRAVAAERRLARQAGPDATLRVVDLRAAERRLSVLATSIPPLVPREKHVAWRNAYAKAGVECEKLALALAHDFAPLREGLERLDLGLEDIQARLEPNEALVDYLRSGGRYFAWIVRSEGTAHRVDLGEVDRIDAAAEAFVCALAAGRSPSRGLIVAPGSEEPTAGADPGETLRRLVFAPVETELGEAINTIYLSPDAALAAVPFAALPGRQEDRYLIDDYLVVQVSTAQDLVPWTNEALPGKGTVAIGDVDFTSASEKTELPILPAPTGLATVDRAPRGRSFVPLPETRSEVEFIQALLGEGCDVVLGAEATEARFRSELRGKRILHLATHGFVRVDLMRGLRRRKDDDLWLGAAQERQLAAGHDPMNLAGLAFAGANLRDGGHGDDGVLTALEVSHLDLDGIDLVVLSACETALGKAESGEGVIGLVQGFQMAGAKRVIASLWQVDDEATRLLMQHLYDGMLREENPLTPAEALREAALKVRGSTGRGGRSFAAPRYWAAFVAYGR